MNVRIEQLREEVKKQELQLKELISSQNRHLEELILLESQLIKGEKVRLKWSGDREWEVIGAYRKNGVDHIRVKSGSELSTMRHDIDKPIQESQDGPRSIPAKKETPRKRKTRGRAKTHKGCPFVALQDPQNANVLIVTMTKKGGLKVSEKVGKYAFETNKREVLDRLLVTEVNEIRAEKPKKPRKEPELVDTSNINGLTLKLFTDPEMDRYKVKIFGAFTGKNLGEYGVSRYEFEREAKELIFLDAWEFIWTRNQEAVENELKLQKKEVAA